MGHTIALEKSTLPVRTADTVKVIVEAPQGEAAEGGFSKTFSVLSKPEFLAKVTTKDLEAPERVLIGGDDSASIEALASICPNCVPHD